MNAPVPHLGPLRKSVYALGDVTVNMALSSMGLVYTSIFLVQYADVRPLLAGLVPLVGRAVDAFTDPLMGAISDRTPGRYGRRRVWFLVGAAPLGLAFSALWITIPAGSQTGLFAYYTGMYCLLSVAMTIVSVPYLAIQPEMALGYDERTSLNTYRTVGSLLGVLAAVSIPSVAKQLGEGAAGFTAAGVVYGVCIAVPWLAVHRATFERPAFTKRAVRTRMWTEVREVMRHRTFSRLTAVYIMGRISMDLISVLIFPYATFWLLRPDDFQPAMAIFLFSTMLALPVWLRIARGREKHEVFVIGAVWWAIFSMTMIFVQPEWPRWIFFSLIPLSGVAYAVVDVMPWSMVGEVIDEDELDSGERREGLYNGVFTFIRKLGGALGVALVMGLLDLAGYDKGETQTETARQAIRWLTGFAPATFLLIAVWLTRNYPLTRGKHQRIVAELARRREERP